MRPVGYGMDARDPYLYLKLNTSGEQLMRRLKSGAGTDPTVPGLVETAMFVGDAEYADTPPHHVHLQQQVSRHSSQHRAHVDTLYSLPRVR